MNHTRQTEALRAIESALPKWNLTIDDVAFAWSFSTARVTGDLVDIYRGLHGEGPFSAMEADYPAGVLEAHQVHEITDHSDTYRLPIEAVMEPLVQLGLFSEEAGAVMDASYR